MKIEAGWAEGGAWWNQSFIKAASLLYPKQMENSSSRTSLILILILIQARLTNVFCCRRRGGEITAEFPGAAAVHDGCGGRATTEWRWSRKQPRDGNQGPHGVQTQHPEGVWHLVLLQTRACRLLQSLPSQRAWAEAWTEETRRLLISARIAAQLGFTPRPWFYTFSNHDPTPTLTNFCLLVKVEASFSVLTSLAWRVADETYNKLSK